MLRRSWLVLVLIVGLAGPAFPLALGTGGGGGIGAGQITVSEIDLVPTGPAQEIRFSNGSVVSVTGGIATVTTGTAGGGDVSSNTAVSAVNELALFADTLGKTIKRATTNGVLFGTNGVLSAAIPGTHYVMPSGNVATATQLAANATNCNPREFAQGVTATGAGEGCTLLETAILGTANQVQVTPGASTITLSIPTSPTLPGTTTGTFSGPVTGNVTGNVSGNAGTASAFASNPQNCLVAGEFPTGITAAGVAENCTALPTTLAGTANQVGVSGPTGTITLTTPQDINTTSNVQHGTLGLGVAAPGTAGQLAQTAGSAGITMQTLKRTAATTGNFVDYQDNLGASVWRVDMLGNLAAGSVPGSAIPSGALTYSKIQDVTAARVLGRGDSGTGSPQELGLGANCTIVGTTLNCTGGAPTTATYWTTTAEPGLSAEANLGQFSTGFVKCTVAGGICTPSTSAQISLASEVTGALPLSNLAVASGPSLLLGRGSGSGGVWQEVTLGTNLSLSGTTLNATAGAGGYATIQNEGTGLTPRTTLNFTGTGVDCTDSGGITVCTVPGAAGGDVDAVTITTTSPLTGGTTCASGPCAFTLGIPDAVANGSTKGAATFTSTDFTAAAGVISLNYAGGQAASSGTKGFLTSTDWQAFNAKVASTLTLTATAPLTGGGDLSANRSVACPTCTTSAAALTSGLPVIGQGAQATAVGAKSGNTNTFVTKDASTPAANECAKWDASGNLTTAGAACGSGGGVTTDTAQRAAFYNSTTTVDGAPGLTFASDGTTINTYADRITTVSATGTLGTADGPIVACTGGASDITLTLPAGAATTQRRWTIIKVDSGAGKCLVDANGAETIHGGTGTVEAATQWSRVDLDLTQTTGTPNWSAIFGRTAPLTVADGGTGASTLTGVVVGNGTAAMTATTSATPGQVLRVTGSNTYGFGALDLADTDAITGDLPYANLTPATAASRVLGRGSAAGAGDWQELTLGSGLVMSGTQLRATEASQAFYSFDTSTTMADPGSGDLRINNAAWASVTQMAISDLTSGGTDITQILNTLAAGDGIYIQDQQNGANYARYRVTSAPTDNTSWHQVPLTFVSAAGAAPGNGTALLVQLSAGGGGGATGDVDAVNIATTSPLGGGANCASGPCAFTLVIADAAADGTTKGAATFASADFAATAGVVSLKNDAVTFAKMQNIGTDRLIGRDTAASGDPEELTVGGGLEFTGTGGIQRSAFTGGDVTAAAGSAVTTIAPSAVTYSKMQNVSAASRLLGRGDSGSGAPEELTVGTGLTITGTTLSTSSTGTTTADISDVSVTTATNPSAEAQLKQLTIPAGALNVANLKTEYVGFGRWTVASGTPTLRMRLYLCTVAGCGSGTVITLADFTTVALAANTKSWRIEAILGTATTGATGTVESRITLLTQIGAEATVAPELRMDINNAASAAVDLTGTLYLRLTVLYSTSNASNNVIQRMAALSFPNGYQLTKSVYFPAASMDVEGTCALGTSAALVTNGPKIPAMTCTDADTDGVGLEVVMPDGWTGGTITIELQGFYTGTTHAGHIVDFNVSGQCVRDGDPVAAWAITSGATAESTSNRDIQLTASGTANREIHGTSLALTLSGTCAGGAHVYLHALIDASATTFTPMSEFKLLGAKLEYTSTGTD